MHKIITLGTSHGDPTLERFNSSTLLECNGKRYLLDAGAPAAALLIRRGIAIRELQGIFLTHMHEDHFGGLSGLLKHIVKYPPARPIPVFLPEVMIGPKMQDLYRQIKLQSVFRHRNP